MQAIQHRHSQKLKLVLLVCGMVVLGWLGWNARNELRQVFTSIEPGYFIAAILLGILFTAAQGRLFAYLLSKHDGRGGNQRAAVAAFLVAQPGKYIPGKIWTAVMQSISLHHQHSLARVAIVNVELVVISAIHMTALGIFLLLLPSYLIAGFLLAVGIVIAAAIMRLPTARIAKWLPSKFRKSIGLELDEEGTSRITFHTAIISSGALAAVNLIASLFVLWSAGDTIDSGQHAGILAVFYLGFAASFLALPVPAALGVREAAVVGLGLALIPDVSGSLLISVALLARCWQLIIDVACFGLGAAIQARHRNCSPSES